MEKRTLINLAMAAVLGGLVLLAVNRPGLETPTQPAPLTQLDREQVDRIVVNRAGQPEIRLQRQRGQWQLQAPYQAPGNGFRLTRLLELLSLTPARSYTIDQLDLSQLGLDRPVLRVRFNDTEIAFGRLNPLDQTRYIRLAGQIHLIPDDFFELLNGPVTGLVDTALLPERAEIAAIVLPNQHTLREQGGKWVLTPAAVHAGDAVQGLLTHWRHDRALTVTEYDGNEQPQGQVRIELKGVPSPVLFDVLGTEPELVLGRPDLRLAYHMSDGSEQKLLTLAGD